MPRLLGAALLGALGAASAYDLNVALFAPLTAPEAETQAACTVLGGEWDAGVCTYGRTFAAMSAMGLLAVDHFNARNGELVPAFAQLGGCQAQIQARTFDTGFSSKLTVSNTINMLADAAFPVHAVVGPATSAAAISQSLVNGAVGVPQISYWATSTELERDQYELFMRTIPSDGDVADAICAYWQEVGYRHVGVLYLGDAYGDAYKEAVVSNCLRRNLTSVFTFAFSADGDIAGQVRKLAETKVRVFLLVALDGVLETIVREGARLGMFENSMWLVSDGVSSDEIASLGPDERAAFNGALRVLASGGQEGERSWDLFKREAAALEAAALPTLQTAGWPASWRAFDNPLTGVPPDTAEIRNVGTFMFDAVAALGIGACLQTGSGATLPNETFGATFLSSTRERLDFEGLTGRVRLSESGSRDKLTASYEMTNVLFDGGSAPQFPVRGRFKQGSWELGDTFVYAGGSTERSLDVERPVEDKNYAASVRTALYGMAGTNLMLAWLLFLWSYANRNHIIVRASQLPFLLSICLGVIVSSTSILAIAGDDSGADEADALLAYTAEFAPANIACMASVWLYSMGFTIAFGALFARMWRIQRLFRARASFKRVVVRNSQLFCIIATLLALDAIPLSIWSATDPLVFKREILQYNAFDFPTESSGECRSDSSTTFLVMLGLFHFGILLVGNFIAWKTRKVNSTFAEGKYVGIAMWSYVQVLLLGIPVIIIVSDEAPTLMFVKGGIVFLNDFSLLLILFGPKVVAVHLRAVDTSGQGGELLEAANSSGRKATAETARRNGTGTESPSEKRVGAGTTRRTTGRRSTTMLGHSSYVNTEDEAATPGFEL